MTLQQELKLITGKKLTSDVYEQFFHSIAVKGQFDLKMMQKLVILLLRKVEELETLTSKKVRSKNPL